MGPNRDVDRFVLSHPVTQLKVIYSIPISLS